MLVEDKLLGPYFAEARALLAQRQKQLVAEVEGKSARKFIKCSPAKLMQVCLNRDGLPPT